MHECPSPNLTCQAESSRSRVAAHLHAHVPGGKARGAGRARCLGCFGLDRLAGFTATLFLTLVVAYVVPAEAQTCSSPEACLDTFSLDSGGTIPLYRTDSLIRNSALTRAVIVIHGNRRDADHYFGALVDAARAEGRPADTLLLAPRFQTAKDHPSPGQHYWSKSGWKIGNRSRDAARISSFAVLDQLLSVVCPTDSALFPRMKNIVIIGHSAGGQFVQRYAAGGAGCPNSSVEIRYVVMNPSSYLYVDGRRRADGQGAFRKNRFGCWDYDEYKYGMGDLNAYMEKVGKERLRKQLFDRPVYYLAGERDIRPDSSSLDKSCEAGLQGPNRLARHRNYRDYTQLFDAWRGSVFLTIPDVGHQGSKMLMSEAARRIMFR